MRKGECPTLDRARKSMQIHITSGAYTGKLPSMDILAERYGTSRLTMRNALKELEAKGLVHIRQGRGSFVIPSELQEVSSSPDKIPGTFSEAIIRYSEFLRNPQIPREVRARMILLADLQMELFGDFRSQ